MLNFHFSLDASQGEVYIQTYRGALGGHLVPSCSQEVLADGSGESPWTVWLNSVGGVDSGWGFWGTV